MPVIERFKSLYSDLTLITPADLEKVYSDDVFFVDPIDSHQGIEEVKTYFSKLTEEAESCRFDIDVIAKCEKNEEGLHFLVNWTMHLVLRSSGKYIELPGTTQLKVHNDKICYHRDFYDLGTMVYEHIPVLGWIVKKIKAKLSS
ncbi:nuclear transport factor 2 family protein [Alteromonas antoniana]|uniref:nuclear transport factor 2 family protein n=1 Tax=Alteromonas antoniana TaxID=2803813 RepID=UPI001C46C84E|nr:nuclear transport factor 2 family protein [Alteromonas antoniana]